MGVLETLQYNSSGREFSIKKNKYNAIDCVQICKDNIYATN